MQYMQIYRKSVSQKALLSESGTATIQGYLIVQGNHRTINYLMLKYCLNKVIITILSESMLT